MRVLVSALFTAILSSATSVLAAPIVSFTPVNQVVTAGQTSSLGVTISDAEDVFAFQFDIGFDPTIIQFSGISEGLFLATSGPTFFIEGVIDNSVGAISFTANTLLGGGAGVDGAGGLATMTFKALAVGSSALSLFNVVLLDSSLSSLDFSIAQGSVDVAARPAPEPGVLLLLGTSALAAFARARRRTRARA